jgi:hypothetical protein
VTPTPLSRGNQVAQPNRSGLTCYRNPCAHGSNGCFRCASPAVHRRVLRSHIVDLLSSPLPNAQATLSITMELVQRKLDRRRPPQLHTVGHVRRWACCFLRTSIHNVETNSLLARNWSWPRSPKDGGEQHSTSGARDTAARKKLPMSFGVACAHSKAWKGYDFRLNGSKISTPYSVRLGALPKRRRSRISRGS